MGPTWHFYHFKASAQPFERLDVSSGSLKVPQNPCVEQESRRDRRTGGSWQNMTCCENHGSSHRGTSLLHTGPLCVAMEISTAGRPGMRANLQPSLMSGSCGGGLFPLSQSSNEIHLFYRHKQTPAFIFLFSPSSFNIFSNIKNKMSQLLWTNSMLAKWKCTLSVWKLKWTQFISVLSD